MTDKDREKNEAMDAPQETVSFPFDRMTVGRFREAFPNAGGPTHFKPGRFQARPHENASIGGSPPKPAVEHLMKKSGAEMPTSSSLSSVHIFKSTTAVSVSRLLSHGRSLTNFGKYPSRAGTATIKSGRFPTPRTTISSTDGKPLRMRRSGLNPKNATNAPKRAKAPQRKQKQGVACPNEGRSDCPFQLTISLRWDRQSLPPPTGSLS